MLKEVNKETKRSCRIDGKERFFHRFFAKSLRLMYAKLTGVTVLSERSDHLTLIPFMEKLCRLSVQEELYKSQAKPKASGVKEIHCAKFSFCYSPLFI